MTLSAKLIGTWELLSRQDRNATGKLRPEPMLGANPLGLLIYDRSGRFALQLMKRRRAGKSIDRGYDAYFGTYAVDDECGIVTQTLRAALSAEHVGSVITREMSVEGDKLHISLNTTNAAGEAVTRTLLWRRVA